MNALDPSSLATELLWLVLGAGLALPLVVLASVQHLRTDRVASPWLLLGAWGVALLPTALGGLLLWGWADKDADALRLATTSFAALRLGGPLVAFPVALLTVGAAGFFAFRDPARDLRRGAALGALGMLAVGAVLLGGQQSGDLVFSATRAAGYAALLLPAALAASGPRPVMALAPWALVVALGEAAFRGMVVLMVLLQTPTVPRAKWAAAVTWMEERVVPQELAGWGALALALAAVVAAAAVARRRDAWLAAAVTVALGLGVLGLADLGRERLDDLATLCPEQAPSPPDGP